MILGAVFSAAYMQRALLAIVIIGVVAGVIGVHVNLRHQAFFADALTHTVFPGVAVAFAWDRSLYLGAAVAGLISAVAFAALGRRSRVTDDGAIAVILTSFFAVGVVVVSRQGGYTSDLVSLLFGQVLTVRTSDVVTTAVIGAVALGLIAVAHRALVYSAFDPDGASAAGMSPARLDLVLNLAVTLVVVASLRAVGSLLVIAVLITPAAISRVLARRVTTSMLVSVVAAVTAGVAGLTISYVASVDHGVRLATGATIAVVLTVMFGLATAWTAISGAALARTAQP